MTEPMTQWATAADVDALTGIVVEAGTVTQAQTTIDLYAGRLPEDAPRIGSRDRYWLKLAVVYQAAWLPSQPDVFERLEVESTGSTSGVQFAPQALTLAPFAKSALRRVSWLRSQSLHVRAPDEPNGAQRVVYGDDGPDPGVWRPL